MYFSDTGGGHRSSAEAIIEALQLEYGDALTTEMVDAFKLYAPIPLNKMPDLYPTMVKAPKLWGASFRATDGRARVRILTASAWPYVSRSVKTMIRNHPACGRKTATVRWIKKIDDEIYKAGLMFVS